MCHVKYYLGNIDAEQTWYGLLVANPVALDQNLEIDFDRYAEHIVWLAESGCDGITPNGSLGEYQTLTADERARVVTTAIEAAPDGFSVIPAVSAYGSRESAWWAEQAAEAGAVAVMALPPELLSRRRARRDRPLPRAGGGRAACGRLQQPDRHEGRPGP